MSVPHPPRAKVVPERIEAHGHVRTDPYYWLRNRDDPEVIAHLEAENAYAEAVMAGTAELQEELYREIVGRIVKDDASVPYRRGDHYYSTRYEGGEEYLVHCRRRGSLEAPEEVVLDENALARGHDFFALRGFVPSPGQGLLAYAVDTVGHRICTLRFRDLATGEDLPDVLREVSGAVVWYGDDRTVLYARQDPATLRSYRIYRHVLGSDPESDALIYEEEDETFNVFLGKTTSKRYLVIVCHQTTSTEVWLLDAEDAAAPPRLFLERERGHEYEVDHYDGRFYLRTNRGAKDFRLVEAPEDDARPEAWRDLLPARDGIFLEGFELFRDHLVAGERHDGLLRFYVMPRGGGEGRYVGFDEPAYKAYPVANFEADEPCFRFRYTSMTTPDSTYDDELETGEKRLLKRQPVLGGFDPDDYRTERLHAPARDGRRIPISIVYRRDLDRGGPRPLLLYGYGAYGVSIDASFSSARLSLLDRGFVYAIAHVRGGQELGRDWYEGGKLTSKENTFHDFIDAAEHLVAEGRTAPDRLFAMGGSAGGLLVGAVINRRGDLFRGAVARVPFVDVVTTMLDPEIPLTTGEYDEWGHPGDGTYYHYMLAYSPYDNVEAKDYPHLLVTAGLHDSQVQYWEPAKWVAKLRATKTDDRRLLLKTWMDAGHSGSSGRFRQHRETAMTYAFLLDLAGLA